MPAAAYRRSQTARLTSSEGKLSIESSRSDGSEVTRMAKVDGLMKAHSFSLNVEDCYFGFFKGLTSSGINVTWRARVRVCEINDSNYVLD